VKPGNNPVESINNGKRTVSYRVLDHPAIDAIDRLLLEQFHAPVDLYQHLKTFMRTNISVGREEPDAATDY